MEKRVKFGLIGRNISYSFSKKYFEDKFRRQMLGNYEYELYDLQEIQKVETLFCDSELRGLNVTIPYKQKVQPYLDELSPEAEVTGAVNCIHIRNGKRKGFNTDTFGFEKTLLLHRTSQGEALVLGDGGAAKAVHFVLEENKIPYKTVSRKGNLTFAELTEQLVTAHELIIQCTPVGTFPHTEDTVHFPFKGLTQNHLAIDLIYNPPVTKFMREAAKNGAKTANGFYMLEQQAEKSWEIWNS